MTKAFTYLTCFLLLFGSHASAQSVFRVMSYNAENFFDTEDNPECDDDEFLPDGNRRWNMRRYRHKIQQTARVIAAAGEWDMPALVALCEVENDTVVTHLLRHTLLKHLPYSYTITHGADRRGINSALLYRHDMFSYISSAEHSISFTQNRHKRTRNILHVSGCIVTGDTLDVFVCHFPSLYGGEKNSETYRTDACHVLRHLCDSLFAVRLNPQIIIMGDFNYTAENSSIAEVLGARKVDGTANAHRLYNLFAADNGRNPKGSHKYMGEWHQLDHIIVSGSLLSHSAPMRFVCGSNRVFAPPFILTRDKTHGEERPFRTYLGFKYEGGFSDHLPLLSDFLIASPR